MASPTWQSSAIAEGSGTTPAVNAPSGVASGDLLICVVGSRDGTDLTGSGTYTEFKDDGATPRNHILYRVATADSNDNFSGTLGSSQWVAMIHRVTGAEAPATQAPEASTGATGTSNAPNPDSISPTGGSKDYLFLAVATRQDGRNPISAAPTNYSNLTEGGASSGSGMTCAAAERQNTTATEDPGAFTSGRSADWAALTVAIHPVASGPEAVKDMLCSSGVIPFSR